MEGAATTTDDRQDMKGRGVFLFRGPSDSQIHLPSLFATQHISAGVLFSASYVIIATLLNRYI